MSESEYRTLRDTVPWMRLPDYRLLGDAARESVSETSVEEAPVKRLAKILAADFVDADGFTVPTKTSTR